MSTTLHERPPHQVAEHRTARETALRPSALDRLALRVGLLLITYGRRRYATPRDFAKRERAHRRAWVAHREHQRDRALTERELRWAEDRWRQRQHV